MIFLTKQIVINLVYNVCLWLNEFLLKLGLSMYYSLRELVMQLSVSYKKDCKAGFGSCVEARTEEMVTNIQIPRRRNCTALGPSVNRQGSLKCFDLKTGKLVVRRVADQIQWLESMIKIVSAWGRKSKKLIMKDSVQFLNRKG